MKISTFLASLLLLLVAACSPQPKYHIGVSQCSEDDWRALLNLEIQREARFVGDMDVEMRSAADNSQQQTADIEQFIRQKKDLIIVAPNEAEEVRPAIEKAYDQGIPVILIDRRITGEKFTAFIGADNNKIGQNIADFIDTDRQGQTVQVVEIRGLKGSSPEKGRHEGFVQHKSQEVNLVESVFANWNEKEAEAATAKVLDRHSRIDYIYAHNDRMALGAYNALKKANREQQTKVIGVDGLILDGGGADMVLDGRLLATHLYPTGGSEAIQLAHKILIGEKHDRLTELPAALIDRSNARVMKLQYGMLRQLDEKYQKLETLTDRQLQQINSQRWMLGGAIAIVLLLALLLLSQYKVHKEKRQADEIMMMQMTAPLQIQRPEPVPNAEAEAESNSPTPTDQPQAAASENRANTQFLEKVQAIIIEHIGDSDFSVNDIANQLGISRVQLYRKIKAQSDQNVSELIRIARLEKAQEMLRNSNRSISEVAYSVGFSSPSYFTKCFKDHFGHNPSAHTT